MEDPQKSSAKPTITIDLDYYEALLDGANLLLALESAGVDSWDGYEEAKEIYEQIKEEEI